MTQRSDRAKLEGTYKFEAPGITILNGKRDLGDEEPPISTDEASDETACFALRRELWELPVVARFTVRGEPTSKARVRFTNYKSKTKAYTPEKTTQAEDAVGWSFKAATKGHRPDPDLAYGVMALFFCGTRQRRDVDNMLKLILDALNGIAWLDDSQVSEVSAKKTLVLPEDARTEVLVYAVGPVQNFTRQCKQCGKDFQLYPSTGDKQFCSGKCHDDIRRTIPRQQVNCRQCGTPFIQTKERRAYCSESCWRYRPTVTCGYCGTAFTKRRSAIRAVNYCSTRCQESAARGRSLFQAQGICETCGGPMAKKTSRQCRACLLACCRPSGQPKPVLDREAG